MVTRDVKLNSTARVDITNFSILPDTLGATADFVHDGYEVTIALPAECDDERASVSRNYIDSGEISRVEINSIDIEVKTKGRVTIPVEMLNSNCNAFDIADKHLTKELESRIIKYQHIANEAVNVWMRCLRWKLNDWRVGRYVSSVGRYVDVSSVYLIDRENDKNIWAGPFHYSFLGCTAISKECWKTTERSLTNNQLSPVHYDLLFDSESHLEDGEIKRALIEAAMAAEIFIRTIVENMIPDNLNNKIKDHVERAPIRTVFESFLPEQLDSSRREILTSDDGKFKDEILRLFKNRNTLMHSGLIDELNKDLCSIHINNVKRLFTELV